MTTSGAMGLCFFGATRLTADGVSIDLQTMKQSLKMITGDRDIEEQKRRFGKPGEHDSRESIDKCCDIGYIAI
jgi:hypothetical protein